MQKQYMYSVRAWIVHSPPQFLTSGINALLVMKCSFRRWNIWPKKTGSAWYEQVKSLETSSVSVEFACTVINNNNSNKPVSLISVWSQMQSVVDYEVLKFICLLQICTTQCTNYHHTNTFAPSDVYPFNYLKYVKSTGPFDHYVQTRVLWEGGGGGASLIIGTTCSKKKIF